MNKVIVFYDSDCLLCSRFASFVFKYNIDKNIYFSGINSEFYKTTFSNSDIYLKSDSVLFVDEKGNVFIRSKAFFEIVKRLKSPIRLLLIFKITPQFILDAIYNFIARNRKRWWRNKSSECEIVQSEFAERILK